MTTQFEMVADDDHDNPIRAASSTACQTIVLRNINKARCVLSTRVCVCVCVCVCGKGGGFSDQV